MPTTHAIQSTSYALGLNPDNTLQIVRQYGIRNDLLDANLLPMIKKGLFTGLARRLCLDRIDIPLIFPASDKADRKILEGLLDAIIDLWFYKNKLDPANYQMWNAKSELENEYNELNNSFPAEREAKVNQQISKEIAKTFKQNLRKSNKED